MLDLKFSKQTSKFLEKCNNDLYKRIMKKIKDLLKNPYPPESAKVKGRKDDAQRVRIGEHRIIYVIFKENKELFIADIDKRGRVYE